MIYKFLVFRTTTLDVTDYAYVEAKSYDEAYEKVQNDNYEIQDRNIDSFSAIDNDIEEITHIDDSRSI